MADGFRWIPRPRHGGRTARPFLQSLLGAICACAFAATMEASVAVSLAATPASSAPVGTMISWTTAVVGSKSSDLWYRFRVRPLDGAFRVIRDYGPLDALEWTSINEGVYELEVSVRERGGHRLATARTTFEIQPRTAGVVPVVSETSHPLVFLYSGLPCQEAEARVGVWSEDNSIQYTRFKPCAGPRTVNFYLAGLAANTSYAARLETHRALETVVPIVHFKTGAAPSNLPAPSVLQSAAIPGPERILLQSPLYHPAIATDLQGNLLWYGPGDLSLLTNPGANGTFYGLLASGIDEAHDVVREFDLVGMTLRETNVARVNEQLAALGKRRISGFHHEARSISGNRTVVLGSVEQILTDVQGPGPVNVIGDMVLVLDSDFQVVWAWDAFDHLDTSRRAVLGETCFAYVGCAQHDLGSDANDWTHGNSVAESPDGGLLYSARHQDWLIKIDYRGGEGNGEVLWRLGKDGDFLFDSSDPYPWFSHQHDAAFEADAVSTITLFDNGNTRVSQHPGQPSRGQVIELDEEHRVARLLLNADLRVFSSALGAAQRLDDGGYQFAAGLVFDPAGLFNAEAFSMQVTSDGSVVSSIALPMPVYRSFRVDSLYGRDEMVHRKTRVDLKEPYPPRSIRRRLRLETRGPRFQERRDVESGVPGIRDAPGILDEV